MKAPLMQTDLWQCGYRPKTKLLVKVSNAFLPAYYSQNYAQLKYDTANYMHSMLD